MPTSGRPPPTPCPTPVWGGFGPIWAETSRLRFYSVSRTHSAMCTLRSSVVRSARDVGSRLAVDRVHQAKQRENSGSVADTDDVSNISQKMFVELPLMMMMLGRLVSKQFCGLPTGSRPRVLSGGSGSARGDA
jgi:hypothetical protein